MNADFSISTDRLILRPFTEGDIEPSYQMNLDEEVSRYTLDGGVLSREEIARRIRDDVMGDYNKHGFGRFAIEHKKTGTFIGFAGLKYLEDLEEVDLGYRLRSDFWGMGLATEASQACLTYGFTALNLPKIIAMVLPENTASIRVLKKLHFTFEKEFLEEGHTAHLFVLTKERYETFL